MFCIELLVEEKCIFHVTLLKIQPADWFDLFDFFVCVAILEVANAATFAAQSAINRHGFARQIDTID